jgi:hypothetical protein
MNSDNISIIIQCWHDLRSDAVQLRVLSVDTGEEVQLSDGSFLLRTLPQDDPAVLRCFIQHIPSGREAHIQGGSHLRDFVEACLLQVPGSLSESSAPGGREDLSNGQRANEPDARP